MTDETTDFVIPAEAREDVSEAIFIHRAMGGPVLSASPCGCGESFRTAVERQRHAADAVIAAALHHLRARQQPVADRKALIHAMARADRRPVKPESASWQRIAEETYGRHADAVLALLPTEAEPDFVSPMCEEIGCVLRLNHPRQHIDEDANAWPLPEAETKALAETATQLGHALGKAEGRKEAAEEIAQAIEARHDSYAWLPHAAGALNVAAGIARDIGKGDS